MLTDPTQSPDFQARAVCFRCRRPQRTCLCPSIVPRLTRTRFVLLTHPMEYKKERIGSGRAAHLSLPNSEVLVGVDFSDVERVNALIEDPSHECFLVYPGNAARTLAKDTDLPKQRRKLVLFLVDATWPCAKKIVRLSANLQRLPRVSFDVSQPSEFWIKQQPDATCISTVEALHRVLTALGESGLEDYSASDEWLLAPFRKMVEMQVRFAADPSLARYRPSGGFRTPSERRVSKKHGRRRVALRD